MKLQLLGSRSRRLFQAAVTATLLHLLSSGLHADVKMVPLYLLLLLVSPA
jgi:hypothetical protein